MLGDDVQKRVSHVYSKMDELVAVGRRARPIVLTLDKASPRGSHRSLRGLSDLSRRDDRTKPGVSTPGKFPARTRPEGAADSSFQDIVCISRPDTVSAALSGRVHNMHL